MLLRTKVVLVLSTVVVVYAGLDSGAQHVLISPSFAELEREEAKKDLDRTVDALQREIQHLDARCSDWAAWDDTYRFVAVEPEAAPDPAYIASNLGRTTALSDHA